MSRIASALLLLCLLGGRAPGQSPEQLFQQGNMQYQQGKLAEARQIYEGLLVRGYVSGELYYNLGNAYYKSGDLARAILNYERAVRYIPQDDDLRHNLQLANMLIMDRIEPVPRLFFWDLWDDLKNLFSLWSATWTLYAMFLVVLGSLTWFIMTRRYRQKKVAFLITATSTVLFFGMLVIFLARLSDFTRADEGIVLASIATAKNSPDEKSSDAFVLHSGVKVRIIDAVTDWIEIGLADGKVGWVQKATVEII